MSSSCLICLVCLRCIPPGPGQAEPTRCCRPKGPKSTLSYLEGRVSSRPFLRCVFSSTYNCISLGNATKRGQTLTTTATLLLIHILSHWGSRRRPNRNTKGSKNPNRRTQDPTEDQVRKMCTAIRAQAGHNRALIHYNGHGVPRPTANGEIWVFNSVSILVSVGFWCFCCCCWQWPPLLCNSVK